MDRAYAFSPPPKPGTDGYSDESAQLLNRWLTESTRLIQANYQWRATPVALDTFTSGNLPAPGSFPHNLIWVTGTGTGSSCVAVSDGVHWRAITLGTNVT